jgi:hypothetical protein
VSRAARSARDRFPLQEPQSGGMGLVYEPVSSVAYRTHPPRTHRIWESSSRHRAGLVLGAYGRPPRQTPPRCGWLQRKLLPSHRPVRASPDAPVGGEPARDERVDAIDHSGRLLRSTCCANTTRSVALNSRLTTAGGRNHCPYGDRKIPEGVWLRGPRRVLARRDVRRPRVACGTRGRRCLTGSPRLAPRVHSRFAHRALEPETRT